MSQGLFVGSLGPRAGGLAGPAGACDEAEGQSWCVLSSRPVCATHAVGPGVVPYMGRMALVDLASNASLLCLGKSLNVTGDEIKVLIP